MSAEEPTALAYSRQDIRAGKATPIIESLVRIIDAQERQLDDIKAQVALVRSQHTKQLGGTPNGDFAYICSCGHSYWPCSVIEPLGEAS